MVKYMARQSKLPQGSRKTKCNLYITRKRVRISLKQILIHVFGTYR